MKVIAAVTASVLAIGSLGLSTGVAVAAKHDAYAQRKAECKREAKGKHFGVHFMKRDRWVKNCIAGHRT